MSAFEDAGRVIDREMKKLREFFESDIKPTTQRRAVEALRRASAELSKLAEKIAKSQKDQDKDSK